MNKRIALYKRLDRIAGPVLVSIARLVTRPRKTVGQGPPSKVLVIRPGGIGDAVLLIPAIALLKKKYPDAVINVLAEKRNSAVFALYPDISHIYRYDVPREFSAALRSTYDVVIDTEQWHRLSAVAARLTRAPTLIGYATNERKKLFTHPVPYSHDDYEVYSFLHLLEPLLSETEFDPDLPFLSIGPDLREKASHLLRGLSDRRVVTIFPGGSVAERRWGSDRFHAVVEQLSRRGYGIVVVGGKSDVPAGEGIVRGIPAGLNLCGGLSLPETAAVLSLSSLLITGDSGIMHLGYAVGTKVVALFGPGIEQKWAPRSPRVAILNKHLSCSPCTEYGYTPKCRRDAACMKEISADEVMESAMALLEKT